ncbi:9777_t:CDS:2, partial [Dentiscutata heterogama]
MINDLFRTARETDPKAFLPNFNLSPHDGIHFIELIVYITDPGYNASNQESAMVMTAFDRGK